MTGNGIKFDASGLIPAIVQHARSGEVLMLGYMNEEALQQTLVSGYGDLLEPESPGALAQG
jgi:phosphoribosyl-AMP cyclohydrolase